MIRPVVIFVALLAVVCGQTTDVSQCQSSNGPLPTSTHIAGCTTQPCSLPQLQDAVINIEFEAPRDIQRMKTTATAYLTVLGIQLPGISYDLGKSAETCNFLENSNCPVSKGDVLNYTLPMYIEPIFPVGVRTTVEFEIVDEANNDVITCIRVDIVISPPNSRAGDTVRIADANN